MTLEDRYRKQWQNCFQKEQDSILRASMLSTVVREYLEVRYQVPLIRATPEEARDIVRQAQWSDVLQDAVNRILDRTDMIRFAGEAADDRAFAELTRNLEVVLAMGEKDGI